MQCHFVWIKHLGTFRGVPLIKPLGITKIHQVSTCHKSIDQTICAITNSDVRHQDMWCETPDCRITHIVLWHTMSWVDICQYDVTRCHKPIWGTTCYRTRRYQTQIMSWHWPHLACQEHCQHCCVTLCCDTPWLDLSMMSQGVTSRYGGPHAIAHVGIKYCCDTPCLDLSMMSQGVTSR